MTCMYISTPPPASNPARSSGRLVRYGSSSSTLRTASVVLLGRACRYLATARYASTELSRSLQQQQQQQQGRAGREAAGGSQ